MLYGCSKTIIAEVKRRCGSCVDQTGAMWMYRRVYVVRWLLAVVVLPSSSPLSSSSFVRSLLRSIVVRRRRRRRRRRHRSLFRSIIVRRHHSLCRSTIVRQHRSSSSLLVPAFLRSFDLSINRSINHRSSLSSSWSPSPAPLSSFARSLVCCGCSASLWWW